MLGVEARMRAVLNLNKSLTSTMPSVERFRNKANAFSVLFHTIQPKPPPTHLELLRLLRIVLLSSVRCVTKRSQKDYHVFFGRRL